VGDYRLELGTAENLNHEPPYFFDIKDRTHHVYIIGRSGMGKSTLLERMADYDMQNYPVIFLDPKGESTKKLYFANQDKDILYISVDNPIIINPLRKDGYTVEQIVDEFFYIIDAFIVATTATKESTVLMRELLDHSIRALNEEDRNVETLASFLLYEDVRKEKSRGMKDEFLKKYWSTFDDFESAKNNWKRKNQGKIESAARVSSRLFQVCRGGMRPFLFGKNEFDIEEIIRNNKKVLVDTSRLGSDGTAYLSNLIVYSIISYCQFKKKIAPLFVYVDEFQTVASNFFSEALEFARGKDVGFTIAHHNFSQLEKNGLNKAVLGAVLGIVGNYIVFNCGSRESKEMSDIFGLSVKDFMSLGKYTAWIKIGGNNTLTMTDPPLIADLPPDFSIPKGVFEENTHPPTVSYLQDGWIEC